MKDPRSLLRTAVSFGFVFGLFLALGAPGSAAEQGLADKGSPINFTELASRKAATESPAFRRGYKRLQTQPRQLPITQSGQSKPRTALGIAQASEAPPPEVLPQPSPDPSLSFLALPDSGE